MSKVAAAACVAVAVMASVGARQRAPSPVHPLFDLSSPHRSPFPSDHFTVADTNQITSRRVNLPMPDCARQASECEDRAILNQLDGFNLQARMAVPFSGAIDPSSVSSRTVFLANLDAGRGPADAIIGINHVVWDPGEFELSFRPDRALDQHTRYALVVTNGVRDANGDPIAMADEFKRYLRGPSLGDAGYQVKLREADAAVRRTLDPKQRHELAALSVFTTQTVSHMVERIRDVVRRAPAPALDFGVGPAGARAVFNAADIQTLINNTDVTVAGPLTPQSFAQALENMRVIPGAVGTVAFGTFEALDFTVRKSGHVPPIATRTGTLAPAGSLRVAFNLWLPSGTPPSRGWPVAIFGHGSFAAKNAGFPSSAVLTSHGLAVISISAMGHGAGPRTTMTIGLRDGSDMTFAAPGLGYDADGDGAIATWEPQRPARPFALLAQTSTILQTTALHLQLVRAIQAGVDVDRNGAPDLDGARIYYYGQSLGSVWGMLAFTIDPAIRAAAFVVPPGTLIYNTTLSPAFRSGFGQTLSRRSPSLLNETHGLTSVDGRDVEAPHFNESLPLRNQPPLVNTVAGATAIQRVIDHIAWTTQTVNTTAFAPLLRRSPLAGIPVRPFIVQTARSDPASTNPVTSEMARAGDFADRVFFYRHDVNFGNAGVPPNAHLFMTAVGAPASFSRVALGAQHQIATLFESDGKSVSHPTPAELWEAPIRTLPEDLFLLPRPR